MRFALLLLILGAVVMGLTITYGFVAGDFWAEGAQLMEMPWGRVSLIDVYVGFLLFAGWVFYRERSVAVAVVWLVLILTLGNFTTCVYAVIALLRSGGDAHRFWRGHRAVTGSAR